MAMKMYDLCGEERERRFSPYCWRIKMALAHKGLKADLEACRFVEKSTMAELGGQTFPTLSDGETHVTDSWKIAEYLDQQYPDKPLFAGDESKALSAFFRYWVETQLSLPLLRTVILDIHAHLDEESAAYFRESREQRFGASLEDFAGDSEEAIKQLQAALLPARLTLKSQAFIGGEHPSFADYILFGHFMWARSISDKQLLKSDDTLYAWRERMLDLYQGLGRSATGYDCHGAA